ncbi:hypothetical protein LLT7_03240 [Lactococcus cremoris subsp. cremoris TIFN7]|nr:hypothetical protein LLT7_03240 [Lactococcus cremoris subsp. cremoris TIFN7]
MYFELRILTENDKNIIEHFFEEASDYAILESGESNPQLECESLLNDLPPEKLNPTSLSMAFLTIRVF